MNNNVNVSASEKLEKIKVYDWLRGLACLAVVFGHFKPFGLNKVYFVWSVHAFILVTVVLIFKNHFSFEKLIKRLAYVAFIYLALFLIFRPLFIIQHIQPLVPLKAFFFNPVTVFIDNPYFAHLWYLLVYVQLLFFLFFTDRLIKKWDWRWVLLGAVVITNLSFTLTYDIFKKFPTLLLPSWSFTIAAGMFLLPKLTLWMKQNSQYRMMRFLLSCALLAAIWSCPQLRDWLILSHARVSLLSTIVYFLCIYAAMELYFIVDPYPVLFALKKFVFLASRYTLTLYIYHQGVGRLLEPYAISREALTGISIVSGILVGHFLHHAFLYLDRGFKKIRIFFSKRAKDRSVPIFPSDERVLHDIRKSEKYLAQPGLILSQNRAQEGEATGLVALAASRPADLIGN